MNIPKTASGPITPVSEDDMERDEIGFTNPNLHRRIDSDIIYPGESVPRDYIIGVFDGTHSYRLTKTGHHDEESTTCEIP